MQVSRSRIAEVFDSTIISDDTERKNLRQATTTPEPNLQGVERNNLLVAKRSPQCEFSGSEFARLACRCSGSNDGEDVAARNEAHEFC